MEDLVKAESFALDHQNYARYGAFQHVKLQSLRKENKEQFNKLKEKRFGASLTGDVFSIVHGDLVTQLFNKGTKGTSGPFRCGFCTNIDSVNTWVNTIYIHAMPKVALRQQLHLKTSLRHNELTKSGQELHLLHIKSLKEKLSGYGIDPFTLCYRINLSSGEKIDKNIYNDMCQVEILGKEKLNEFIQERLTDGKVGFFNPIKKNNLKTEIKSGKKSKNKIVSTLQEDCQAFGLIVDKSLSLGEAFQFPITTVPLSIAFPDGKLRQSEKASFRNYIIKQS